MGLARGRFVVDTHVHSQRTALKWRERGEKPDWANLGTDRAKSVAYDNSPRLLYDMERYGVDMCVLNPGPGLLYQAPGLTDDEPHVENVKKYPDKFVALCGATAYRAKVVRGETEWSAKELCEELDRLLSTGLFVGIGESMPTNPKADPNKVPDWNNRFEEICQICEVARKYKVTVGFPGFIWGQSGYAGARRHIAQNNPLLAHDVAAAFPDVTIIMAHGGMDGWWSEIGFELVLQVAAAHPNIYLETGQWWPELYEKPLRDPNIGAEKLIWGTDWGAAHPVQWWPGGYPSTYFDQSRKEGLPAHQNDIFGHSLRWLDKLDIPQDDLNLILGGNAVKIFKLEDKVPHTRMFKQFLR